MRQGHGQGRAGFDWRKTIVLVLVLVLVLEHRLADVWRLDDGSMKDERRRRRRRRCRRRQG